MSRNLILARLRDCPLIASVQASEGSPLDHPDTLLRAARASLRQGVKVLRLEGVKNLRVMRPELRVPIIGLLKRSYPKSDVYITPTAQDVDSMIDLECQVIALDGTARPRPGRDNLAGLIQHIHHRKRLAMADCDSVESAVAAAAAGADFIGTTLAGYTPARPMTEGPDLDLLRAIIAAVNVPVIAEGRYSERWQVEAALRAGAVAVVVGGALNDPVKQTRALLPRRPNLDPDSRIGAVDIGGTWLRFGVFDSDWNLLSSERAANPPQRDERIDWIRTKIAESGVKRVGVSTGGIVDPRTGEVVTAKEYLMPDHAGIRFDQSTLGVPTVALGDGHATAWAHACLPEYAGKRVAALALGTGVGAGFVEQNRIWCGPSGEYPRINDLPSPNGESYETRLGGFHLKETDIKTDESLQQEAVSALEGAVYTVQNLYFPDVVFVGGSVGLSDWMAPELTRLGVKPSPFGTDAGLFGAAALALFPSQNVRF